MSREIDRNRAAVNSIRKPSRARLACECLEGRALLSGMGGAAAGAGWHSFAAGTGHSAKAGVASEVHSWSNQNAAQKSGTAGGYDFQGFQGGAGGVFGLAGGGSLTALVGLDAGGPGLGQGGPGGHGGPDFSQAGHGGPGGASMAFKGHSGSPTNPPKLPAAVASAQTTLQNDLNAALPAGFQSPSKASIDALQADLKAQHDGTLTGTAATTKLQADKDAILASTGLSSSQVAAVDAASKQLETDLKASMPKDTTTPPTTPPSISPTIQSDINAVLSAAGLSSSQISAINAAQAQAMKDGQAIHDGTLTGTAATTALQTDHNSILSALGASQDSITKINADADALQTAAKSAFGSMTPPTTNGMPTPGGYHGAHRFGRA